MTYGKDSLRYQCAKLWNKTFKTGDILINTDERKKLTKIRSIKGFTETLKKHFLHSYTIELDTIYY